MPYNAKVIKVMIASPGDVAQERQIIKNVIHEWNAINSEDRGIVLMAVGWESHSSPSMEAAAQQVINKHILANCDLLVATFWTRVGTPANEFKSGTIEEIEEHLRAEKPAMICFSSATVRLDSVDEEQYRALQEFKQQCMTRGLIHTYESLSEFQEKGEHLNRESVRSSVARRLGIENAGMSPEDRRVEGIVEITLDATKNFASPLTRERLFGCHAALFPTGYSNLRRIKVGAWRDDSDGPMQVVSGPLGHDKVHFEAPPAARIENEISGFLTWFNDSLKIDPIFKAAIAHLWFVTIHPFEDGNGRIARSLT
jgi:fido (protein-threonine AMPylation protein)